MYLYPGKICLDRPDQGHEGSLEIILLPEKDPVQMTKLGNHFFGLDLLDHDRDQALAVPGGMLDFLFADVGMNRIRAQQDENAVGLLDAFFDLPPPIHSWLDVFPIDPEIKILIFECPARRRASIDSNRTL